MKHGTSELVKEIKNLTVSLNKKVAELESQQPRERKNITKKKEERSLTVGDQVVIKNTRGIGRAGDTGTITKVHKETLRVTVRLNSTGRLAIRSVKNVIEI